MKEECSTSGSGWFDWSKKSEILRRQKLNWLAEKNNPPKKINKLLLLLAA